MTPTTLVSLLYLSCSLSISLSFPFILSLSLSLVHFHNQEKRNGEKKRARVGEEGGGRGLGERGTYKFINNLQLATSIHSTSNRSKTKPVGGAIATVREETGKLRGKTGTNS